MSFNCVMHFPWRTMTLVLAGAFVAAWAQIAVACSRPSASSMAIVHDQTFGDWRVQCRNGDGCVLQSLQHPGISIRAAHGSQIVVTAPFPRASAALYVDGRVIDRVDGCWDPSRLTSSCGPMRYCLIIGQWAEAVVSALRSGRSARIVWTGAGAPAPATEMSLDISQFDQAWNDLLAANRRLASRQSIHSRFRSGLGAAFYWREQGLTYAELLGAWVIRCFRLTSGSGELCSISNGPLHFEADHGNPWGVKMHVVHTIEDNVVALEVEGGRHPMPRCESRIEHACSLTDEQQLTLMQAMSTSSTMLVYYYTPPYRPPAAPAPVDLEELRRAMSRLDEVSRRRSP